MRHPAAFINVIAEGKRFSEALEALQQTWDELVDEQAENSKLKGQMEAAVGALEKVLEVSAFHRSLISEHGFDQTPVEYDATILIAKLKEAGS